MDARGCPRARGTSVEVDVDEERDGGCGRCEAEHSSGGLASEHESEEERGGGEGEHARARVLPTDGERFEGDVDEERVDIGGSSVEDRVPRQWSEEGCRERGHQHNRCAFATHHHEYDSGDNGGERGAVEDLGPA